MANNTALTGLESRLWGAADELRANSKLKSFEYSVPVLGLIFLRYADFKFEQADKELKTHSAGTRRQISKIDYQAQGVMYMPDDARFSKLMDLPEGANIGQAINDVMRAIERENETLRDVLPKLVSREVDVNGQPMWVPMAGWAGGPQSLRQVVLSTPVIYAIIRPD